MSLWCNIWILLIYLYFMVSAQNICEICDCSVGEESSDVRAVRNVKPVCNDGSFKWYNIYGGALRIDFKPRFSGPFQLCFTLQTQNVRVQVSEEIKDHGGSTGSLSRPPTLKQVVAADGQSGEHCLQSSSASIHLFFEPERTVDSKGFSFVLIRYVMEKFNEALLFDPLEECRPCTDKELIEAFCSHDVVIVASIHNVTNKDSLSLSEINVDISKVIRQRQILLEGYRRQGPYISETLTRHIKCGVRHGPGQFLFTGTWRLGQLKMTCSPYYKDWMSVLRRALYSGELEC